MWRSLQSNRRTTEKILTMDANNTPPPDGGNNPTPTPTPNAAPNPTPAQTPNFASFLGEGNTFKPGWTKALDAPESLEKFTSPTALIKSYASLEKMLGNQNKVAIPGENATPEEVSAFRKAIGVPDKVDAYELKAPEGYKATLDEAALGEFKKAALEVGMTPKQLEKMAGLYFQTEQAAMEKFTQQIETARAAAAEGLKKEWGVNTDKELALAKVGAEKLGLSELMKDPAYGDNPTIIKAMNKVAKMLGEEQAAGARGTSHATTNPQAEINRIRGDKNHPYNVRNHPDHAAAVRQMSELYAVLHPQT